MGLKEFAKKMAGREETGVEYYEVEGKMGYFRAIKSDKDSQKAGVIYASEGLGAILARGGEVEETEVAILIKRATDLGMSEDPESFIRNTINQGRRMAESADYKKQSS